MNLETNGMDQVVVITIMTVVVWVIVRFAAIRQFMFRRKVLDDTELSGLFAANDLDASKVLMILRIIGRCYGIPYGVLRPGDCFNGNLWNLDQWKLGFGTRKLRLYLFENFGLRIPIFQIRFRPISIDGILHELANRQAAVLPNGRKRHEKDA
jgi:hypothetical protein